MLGPLTLALINLILLHSPVLHALSLLLHLCLSDVPLRIETPGDRLFFLADVVTLRIELLL